MSKKTEARMSMLKEISKKNRDSSYQNFGKNLKDKKLEKVSVIAPDKEGLEKGLSLAQKILKAKLGEALGEEEEEDSEESEICPVCEDKKCPGCEEEELEEE